jgi:hypothetical protein
MIVTANKESRFNYILPQEVHAKIPKITLHNTFYITYRDAHSALIGRPGNLGIKVI